MTGQHSNGLVAFAYKVGIIAGAMIAVGSIVTFVWHIAMDFTLRPLVTRIEVLAATDTMIVRRLEMIDLRREYDSRALADALAHPLYSEARTEALAKVRAR